MPRPLYEIASDIRHFWPNCHPHAQPYYRAMRELNTIQDMYGADSGKSIVLYFLANASSWRGPDARRIKQELKQLAGIK
jgi:hypothetical protein